MAQRDRGPPPRPPARRAAGRLALPLLLLAACAPAPAPAARPPNVLIWLVDTLRADHLHAYGYHRPTSPNLDRLAAEGVLFEDFHVHANWTQPSVASLLTGRLPVPFEDSFDSRVPPEMTLAAEWFARHGRQTVGLTVTAATAGVFGFDRGFETWREVDGEAVTGRRARERKEGDAFGADRLVEACIEWLDATRDPARPFFAFLHSVDPHLPYEPHPGLPAFAEARDGGVDGSLDSVFRRQAPLTEADRSHLVDMYDDEIRFNDLHLGRLLEQLSDRGLLDETLVVVTADHGEELWDRVSAVPSHGHPNLHRELTRVPLVMRWPARLPAGLRVQGLVRGVDLLPTVVELAGLPPMPDGDGASVAGPVTDGEGRLRRDVVHHVDQARLERGLLALRTDRMLFQFDPAGDRTGLFDLDDDPDERNDLSGRLPDAVASLHELLMQARRAAESFRWGREEADRVQVDERTRAALRALGYLGGDGGG